MLVVVSDLHLTDETAASPLPADAFALFAQRMEDLAVAASYRADGSYRPIDRIDLVLLGDILDCIRSPRWRVSDIRPWSDPHSPEFFNTITRITHEIAGANEASLQVLRLLSRGEAIRIPPATRDGLVAGQAESLPLTVRIFYLVGNRDWFYHLPGPHYDRLRATLVAQLGLANQADRPFAHDPCESEAILETMRRHKLIARHGDIYDLVNFDEDRNASSLGDAIAIELIDRFVSEVESDPGDLPGATIGGFLEMHNLRPLLLAPVWIEGLLERTCALPAQRKKVKSLWDRLTDRFLALDFVRGRGSWGSVDLVDGLARVLKFNTRPPARSASSTSKWLNDLGVPCGQSYSRYALAEQDFRNRRARHIVYGHTHFAENEPLDASYAEGYVLNQAYFNAGTWRRVYRQTQCAPASSEFIAADHMTYLAFFQGDERGGRPYETWTGMLGVGQQSGRLRRIDNRHGTGPAAPHFLLPQAQDATHLLPPSLR